MIRENEKAEDRKEEKKGEAEETDRYSPEKRFEGRQLKAFREAEAYMKRFMPAWEAMAPEDREKLSTYFDRTYGQYVTVHIANENHADPSTVCRRRRGAVRKPVLLFYGAVPRKPWRRAGQQMTGDLQAGLRTEGFRP